MGKTLPEKVWERHLVHAAPGEPDLLYIDLHLVHEVTSPQAFDGLRMSGRAVRRPDLTIATEDHNVPTEHIDRPIEDPISAKQIETLRANAAEFGITNHEMGSPGQGIVHVIGPERLDLLATAETGRTLQGRMPLARLERVLPALASSEGELQVVLDLGKDPAGIRFLAGRLCCR